MLYCLTLILYKLKNFVIFLKLKNYLQSLVFRYKQTSAFHLKIQPFFEWIKCFSLSVCYAKKSSEFKLIQLVLPLEYNSYSFQQEIFSSVLFQTSVRAYVFSAIRKKNERRSKENEKNRNENGLALQFVHKILKKINTQLNKISEI